MEYAEKWFSFILRDGPQLRGLGGERAHRFCLSRHVSYAKKGTKCQSARCVKPNRHAYEEAGRMDG